MFACASPPVGEYINFIKSNRNATRRKNSEKSEKPVEFGGAPGCGPPSSTGSLASPADMSASSSTVGTRLCCTPAEPAAPELSAMPAPRCFWTAPTSEFFFKGKCYQAVLRARMLRVSPRVVPLWLGRGAQVARRAREPACTQQTRRGGRILPPRATAGTAFFHLFVN